MENELPEKKRGRKTKWQDLDREQIWKLACMQCTLREIGDVMDVSHETIRNHFGDLVEQGQSVGKKSLRRAQWEKALSDKSDRMLIFLGKQYLGQSDAPKGGEEDTPLPWED